MGGKWVNRKKAPTFAESKDSRGKVSPWEMLEPSSSACAICFHAVLVVRDSVTTEPILNENGEEQVIEKEVTISQLRPTGLRGKLQQWWFHRQCWDWFISEWR